MLKAINPDKIKIKSGSIIVIRGIPNSGKSTFVRKNLNKFMIVSTDEYYERVYKSTENELLKLIREDKIKEAQKIEEEIWKKSDIEIEERLIELGKKGKTVVYDSLAWTSLASELFFKKISPYFAHTINICIVNKPEDVLRNPLKRVEMIGRRYFNTEELIEFMRDYFNHIESGEIYKGFEESYLIGPEKQIIFINSPENEMTK